MKKGRGLDRALPVLASDQVDAMPTGALLARLRRLRWCEDSPELSDLSREAVASAAHLILFKSDPAWRAAHDDVKRALAMRDHAPKKP